MAFDCFLKFEGGPKGESTDSKHPWEIEIFSFSLGASNPATIGSGSTGGGGGKVSISSFNVMKKTDRASPDLFQRCCSGDHFPVVTVTLRKSGGKNPLEFLKYDFVSVFVESIQWSGASGADDTPTESLSLAFGSVHITYTPQKKDGTGDNSIDAGWDIVHNVAK